MANKRGRQPILLPRFPLSANVDPEVRRWADSLVEEVTRQLNNIRGAGNDTAYDVSNGTIDRTYDADATTVAELADVVYTIIEDLKNKGALN